MWSISAAASAREYVLVTMGLGQWLLVTAEVIHYFIYYMVKGGKSSEDCHQNATRCFLVHAEKFLS